MKNSQQNNDDNQGEFEQATDQIETINQPKINSPPKDNIKSHIRIQHIAQRHKLGLILPPTPDLQIFTYSHTKNIPIIQGKIIKVGSAIFRSNFQCGSIDSVELIGINSFKINLEQETNSARRNTWFYYAVEGVKGQAHFVIGGFGKQSSLYNSGMKLCYRDVKETTKWRRGGTQITYNRASADQSQTKNYQIKYAFFFKNNQQSCIEFAYCFPYGPTKLQTLISQLQPKLTVQTLASTFEGRNLPVLNIGNLHSKQVIVLSARVHPGQTVSSFIMEGFLRQIMTDSDHSNYLKERFLFKVMPMINIDGVAHGNFRFSASGFDLNRRWKNPREDHHPQIYYLKEMIIRQSKQKKVMMYIDMHGHSRKKNVFFYGCCEPDEDTSNNFGPKSFPFLMSKIHDPFCYADCCFTVQKEKEGTARVTMWNQLKINQVFTLEASFCSSQVGSNYLEADYEKMGQKLCEGIALYYFEAESAKYANLSKLLPFRNKVFDELKNDSALLKIGNAENSGSDSEPQKGQKIQLLDKLMKQNVPNLNNQIHRTHQRDQIKTSHNILVPPIFNETNIDPTNRTGKHKSQSAILDDNEHLLPSKLQQIFTPAKQDTSKVNTQKIQNKSMTAISKNIRTHSSIKNRNINPMNIYFHNEEDQSGEDNIFKNQIQKRKRNVFNAFQGAQFLRMKKLVELKEASKPTFEFEKQPNSIVSHTIKLQSQKSKLSTPVVPKFFTNLQKGNLRKNSIDVPLSRRSIQAENRAKSKKSKHLLGVMCLGKQIK